jgi:diguanylate cyclase (GGDEF)-like protein
MDGKYLLLLKDKLEAFSGLFDLIKESAPYRIDVVCKEELVSGKYKTTLDKFKPGDIVVAIDDTYFKEAEREIRAYLDTIDKKPYTFLYLFESKAVTLDSVYTSSKNCYVLYDNAETSQVVHFNLFVLGVFDKAILSFRLSDYIYNSFKEVVFSEILQKKTKELETLKEELERRNRIDTLTGLYNRRALFEFLETERSRTTRYLQHITEPGQAGADSPVLGDIQLKEEIDVLKTADFGIFSIMMIDLDHFKRVNDTFGHLTGDKVLKALGQLFIREGVLRNQDIAGRFGGEEFIVILPNTNAENALDPAIRLVKQLEAFDFRGTDTRQLKVTLSIGISEYHPTDKDNEMIIQRADQAMYHAKQHGRNQIVIYEKVFG